MDNLPKLEKGDIVFVMHHDNWISRAIAWFMGSKWSHCLLVIDPSSSERNYTSETSDYEVTIGWVERYTEDPNVSMDIYRLPALSELEKQTVVSRALSQEESLYPYWQFIALAVRCLFKKVGLKIGNFLPLGYTCNEHVMYAYDESHYPELNHLDPHSMDTEDFYRLIKSIPGVKGIYWK